MGNVIFCLYSNQCGIETAQYDVGVNKKNATLYSNQCGIETLCLSPNPVNLENLPLLEPMWN